MLEMLSKFDILEVVRCTISLLIVIDIIGSLPIILDLRAKGMKVNATKATVLATLFMLGFFYVGHLILRLFSVDIQSFAVAGAFILFFICIIKNYCIISFSKYFSSPITTSCHS